MLYCQTCGKALTIEAYEDTSQFDYRWNEDVFEERRRRIVWASVTCADHGRLMLSAIDFPIRAKWRPATPLEG